MHVKNTQLWAHSQKYVYTCGHGHMQGHICKRTWQGHTSMVTCTLTRVCAGKHEHTLTWCVSSDEFKTPDSLFSGCLAEPPTPDPSLPRPLPLQTPPSPDSSLPRPLPLQAPPSPDLCLPCGLTTITPPTMNAASCSLWWVGSITFLPWHARGPALAVDVPLSFLKCPVT